MDMGIERVPIRHKYRKKEQAIEIDTTQVAGLKMRNERKVTYEKMVSGHNCSWNYFISHELWRIKKEVTDSQGRNKRDLCFE
jgi:hypothetical protein